MSGEVGHFGSWTVGSQRFQNKLAAVSAAVKQGHWIHWDFHDDVFGAHDWTRPPQCSLEALYDHRARSLRDTYDHIAIEYSGGADSWNMLYHFCRQGLKVDTVVHRVVEEVVQPDAFDKTIKNYYAEGRYQAWPSFQKLQELQPDLKWQTWSMAPGIKHGWHSNAVDFYVNNNIMPGAMLKLPGLPGYQDFGIPDRPSSAMLYGIDKPLIEYSQGKFYIVFYDHHLINKSLYEREMIGLGMRDKLFYWDPECVDLLTKQAHIIMDWFKNHTWAIPLMKDPIKYRQILYPLIYPRYQPLWQAEKPTGLFATTCDSWFIDDLEQTGSRAWHRTMHDLTELLKSLLEGTDGERFLKPDHTFYPDYRVLASCPSHRYYLGDI